MRRRFTVLVAYAAENHMRLDPEGVSRQVSW